MDAIKILREEFKELSKLNLNTYSYEYEYVDELSEFKMYDFDEVMINEVVNKSQQAYESFSKSTVFERTNILLKSAYLLEEYKDEFAKIIALEAKKPIKFAIQEVSRCIQTLKVSAFETSNLEGTQINLNAAENGEYREAITKYESLGVVYAMTPFNFPLNLALHKVGPALAVGNSVVIKPSEKTPFTAYLLKYLLEEAGLPKNVYQVITGDGATLTDEMLSHKEVKKVSFTGSPAVGELIKSKVGFRKLTLELGSTSPVYVSNDIDDLDDIANKIVTGAFSYNGQVCISTQKVYVHQEYYDELIRSLKEKMEQLVFGDYLEEATDYCNLIDEKSQTRIMNWIKEAVNEGATIISGGEVLEGAIKPTLLTNVNRESKVCTNEIFGPVLVVELVEETHNIIDLLNQNDFGLNIGVFTNNIKHAMKIANEVDYGQVMINDVPTLRFDHMPYNGRKNSGYGTEGIKYAIKEMSQLKMISINYG
ncbi:aldehyde dehydrogenase family protein [Macrococcus animalis]|uniref:aldehyde dehydrogenase family protein n=1 Tax=Macrococcus animalis TaxID=3395467 RepID=UPI0039BE91D5